MDTMTPSVEKYFNQVKEGYTKWQKLNRGYELYKIVEIKNEFFIYAYTKLEKRIKTKFRFVQLKVVLDFIEKDIKEYVK